MKKYYFLFTSILLIGSLIYYHNEDHSYIAKKNADEAWNNFLPTLKEIVSKGDYLNYKFKNTNNETWNIYNQRISYFVEILNKENAPKMRRNYLLDTNYRDFKSRSSIEFYVYDESTNQLLESKIISSKSINILSLIPPLLVLILFFLNNGLSLSLLAGIFVSSSLLSKSLINGVWFIFTKHVPNAFIANNYYLIKVLIFLFLTHFLIYLVSYTGGFKGLQNFKKTKLKYFYYLIFASHPYFFSSFGLWFLNGIKKHKSNYFHILLIVLSFIFILSPYNLNFISNSFNSFKNFDFINLLIYKLFSFNLIIILIYFYKKNTSNFTSYSDFYSDKTMIKKSFFIINVSIFSFFTFYYISTLFLGIINTDYNSNFKSLFFSTKDIFFKFFSFQNYYNYFKSTDIYLALILTITVSIFISVYFMFQKKLIYLDELLNKIKATLKLNYKYSLYLILSYIFIIILEDLGTSHYIISLFNNKIDTLLLAPISFLIAVLIGIIFGNSIFVLGFLPGILIPIASQMSDKVSIIIIYTIIVEGAIAGELLCPYSPTSIISSSIYQINPLNHIKNQFKIIGIAIIISISIGFLLINTKIHILFFYFLITVSTILFFFKKSNKSN